MQVNQPQGGAAEASTPVADLRLVSVQQLQKIHRDLDACQKVIWLAGGFDEAYVTDAQERLKEIEALLAAPLPAALHGLNDTARLDFMLEKHRKVVVELIPGRCHEVYIEEGFMGDEQYPAVTHSGDWDDSSAAAKGAKRQAIDAAIKSLQVEVVAHE